MTDLYKLGIMGKILVTSFTLLVSLIFTIGESRVNYNGYKVLRVNATQNRAFNAMKNLFIQDELDFWSPPSRVAPTDVLISPIRVRPFRTFLETIGAPYEILIENLDYEIEYERLNYLASSETYNTSEMNWEAYQRLETIHGWMDGLAEKYPSMVTVFDTGNSTEGRPLKVLKISTGEARADKPAIWLDGGIHAREWISPATVTYIANELIMQATRYRNQRLTDAFDWYINPVMNPDGYEYTQVDRLWRKTRSGPRPVLGGFLGWCRGVDPNRNWDFQWAGKGTSRNPCSQIYHGPNAASEPEVKAIQDFVLERKDQIKLFLTFHSYSQILLLPWGYDEVRTDDHDDLMRVGLKAIKTLENVHGTKYTAGNTAEILYAAAGGSHDWAKGYHLSIFCIINFYHRISLKIRIRPFIGSAGIKFAYCYELRDTGKRGFVLPADQIIPSGQETFAAVQSMAEDVMDFYKITEEEQATTVPVEEVSQRLYQQPL
ncbi:Carboxypeptidase A2 [Orchesella cincta]|uniref:Carboxypeptidase A2 n=1 Tax=Orchesella cincta TaxID=48709 RepID=A0A1D2NAI9_ORCCI|nr:Carboxypeptidase A2 [Orchesella cincta]